MGVKFIYVFIPSISPYTSGSSKLLDDRSNHFPSSLKGYIYGPWIMKLDKWSQITRFHFYWAHFFVSFFGIGDKILSQKAYLIPFVQGDLILPFRIRNTGIENFIFKKQKCECLSRSSRWRLWKLHFNLLRALICTRFFAFLKVETYRCWAPI